MTYNDPNDEEVDSRAKSEQPDLSTLPKSDKSETDLGEIDLLARIDKEPEPLKTFDATFKVKIIRVHFDSSDKEDQLGKSSKDDG